MTSPPFAADDELTTLWVWARAASTECVTGELFRDTSGTQARAHTMPCGSGSCWLLCRAAAGEEQGEQEVPLQPGHAQVAVVAAPEALGKGVVFNFQLGYL